MTGYINFIFQEFEIPRLEYDHYCKWVTRQLSCLQFGSNVLDIHVSDHFYEVVIEQDSKISTVKSKNIVLGTGSVPFLPDCIKQLANELPEQVLHTADYKNLFNLDKKSKIVVLGSGQSSAEVFQSLLDQQIGKDDKSRYELDWITRAQGFLQMEYSKLALEYSTPGYVEYFYSLPQKLKDNLLSKQGLFYKGISSSTITSIYNKLYHRSVGQAPMPVSLRSACVLIAAVKTQDGRIELTFNHMDQNEEFSIVADALIAGTGYVHTLPTCIKGLSGELHFDHKGRLQIDKEYRALHNGPGNIFVQNGELHTHGFGAPDLGLGAWRAAKIANKFLPYNMVYRLPQETSFQSFGVLTNQDFSTLSDSNFQKPEV